MQNTPFLQALSFLNLAVAAGVSVLIVLLLTCRQQRSLKLYIGVFYLIVGYCLVICWMARSGLLTGIPFLLYTNDVATFALGPIVYLYTERILNRTVRLRALIPMFLPTAAMLGVVAAYHIGFSGLAGAALRRLSPFPGREEPAMRVACALAELSFSVCFCLCGLRVNASARGHGNGKARELRNFSGLYMAGAATCLAVVVGHLMDSQLVTTVASTFNGLSILAYFLYIHQHPGITQRPLRTAAAVRADERGSGSPPQEVVAKLEALMTRERVYRDPELSLPSLSRTLGISTNQLSLVLNDTLGVNFRQYLNSRRLQEAKDLLMRDARSSILDVAFQVGFNSKTTFNSFFAQDTGMTPKEFRRKFATSPGK